MSETVYHVLPPVVDAESRILILGTMPSPKSREVGYYYGHPQNRFWRILAALFGEPLPEGTPERAAFLGRHHIALWDVLYSCRIEGASDASIREPVPNDLPLFLQEHPAIRGIYTTGTTAGKLYQKLCLPATGRPAVILPSPSAANASRSLPQLIECYRVILPDLSD